MTKICYVEKRFNTSSRIIIGQALEIIEDFRAQGFTLTLRQLYYQFVGKDLISNTQQSYKRLGSIINDARLAGLVDWDAIEDRTRFIRSRSHWMSPEGVLHSAASGYGQDLWVGQPTRVEVWIEKDALVGVFDRICTDWDVPLFSCRGYASQSEVWRASCRHIGYDVPVTILHLGDHDPSGLDMTRDIQDRLRMFGADVTIERLALNMSQVRKFNLPPNPAKTTDSRFERYAREFGDNSWELDAMSPTELVKVVDRNINQIVDLDLFEEAQGEQESHRLMIQKVADNWDHITENL